jgi:hypothetical protein
LTTSQVWFHYVSNLVLFDSHILTQHISVASSYHKLSTYIWQLQLIITYSIVATAYHIHMNLNSTLYHNILVYIYLRALSYHSVFTYICQLLTSYENIFTYIWLLHITTTYLILPATHTTAYTYIRQLYLVLIFHHNLSAYIWQLLTSYEIIFTYIRHLLISYHILSTYIYLTSFLFIFGSYILPQHTSIYIKLHVYCQSQARLKPKRCLDGFIFTLNNNNK